jgi:hypothetical protein
MAAPAGAWPFTFIRVGAMTVRRANPDIHRIWFVRNARGA